MKKFNRTELTSRLILVFFVAVFILSITHFFVYAHLLDTMEQEETTIQEQQAASAKIQMDDLFANVQAAYQEMAFDDAFLNVGILEPDSYRMIEMQTVARNSFQSIPGVYRWFIVMRINEQILSPNGVYDAAYYFSSLCRCERYPTEFWNTCLEGNFSRLVFPEAEFICLTNSGHAKSNMLLPLVIRPYFSYTYSTVLLLDMDALVKESSSYFREGLYLFDENGTLLYTTDDTPILDSVPLVSGFTRLDGVKYTVQQWDTDNGITCVKLLPLEQSTSIVRSSFLVSLIVALSALVVIAALVVASVNRVLHPVNRMLGLLQQHSGLNQSGNIHNAYEELEHILKTRDQQTAELARQDATLSEYFLQAKLKNVHVDMEQRITQVAGTAYILYIHVHYDERCKHISNVTRPELESCLQDIMSDTLDKLFDSTVMFQLEPGRFAARLTVTGKNADVQQRMTAFMARLKEERDFAWFTVVLSEPLDPDTDLASIYVQVREAARLALVRNESQYLALPIRAKDDISFVFSHQDEKAISAYIQKRQFREATDEVTRLLKNNLENGITHAHMELLCIAIINTVFYTMSELATTANTLSVTNGIYNTLATNCSTGKEYIETVANFIAALEPASPQGDELLESVHRYLEKNYAREFSSEDMAGALWVSRSYLSTYYKAKTGINLSDSIQMFRIKKAEDLLKNPSVKIGEVGPMVGIPSSNTFLRNFRKYTGMTPTEYRQKECK